MNYKKWLLGAIVGLMLLGLGTGVGYFLGLHYEQGILVSDLNLIHPLRNHDSSYQFISPLLAYVVPSDDQQNALAGLKNSISTFIDSQKNSGSLSDASVYFYDLNLGRWIGINENEKYNPASMLKVVIMVSYFKEAETNPTILQQNLTYTGAVNASIQEDAFNATSNLQIGQSYSVEDLVEKMIIDSDNGAEVLLFDNIDQNNLDAVYNALNIANPDTVSGTFTISPRTYSLFFRILYSATYLNDDMSEKALSILSQATFKDGLVAGLPSKLVVAHKFGEYVVTNSSNQMQGVELHDCGIVYYPTNPYFLCVMTKGSNLPQLENTIKNISSLVYNDYSNLR